jgi:hypothetical protein
MVRPVFADPKTDFVFQRIFGSEDHKSILLGFLNDLLERMVGPKGPRPSTSSGSVRKFHICSRSRTSAASRSRTRLVRFVSYRSRSGSRLETPSPVSWAWCPAAEKASYRAGGSRR